MNKLALTMEGVLIPQSLFYEYAFQPGDTLDATVNLLGEAYEVEFKIVGVFDLFPVWDPQDGPLIVGNLDYLYEQVGSEFPYDVLVETDPGVDYDGIVEELEDLGIVWNYQVSEQRLDQNSSSLSGKAYWLASIGFLALAFLTVLGFPVCFVFFTQPFHRAGNAAGVGFVCQAAGPVPGGRAGFLLLVGLGAGTGLGYGPATFHRSCRWVVVPDSTAAFHHSDRLAVGFRIYILFGLLFIAALST
jgi:putative ABC transport system permease protein